MRAAAHFRVNSTKSGNTWSGAVALLGQSFFAPAAIHDTIAATSWDVSFAVW
jgi:hypothetical protein